MKIDQAFDIDVLFGHRKNMRPKNAGRPTFEPPKAKKERSGKKHKSENEKLLKQAQETLLSSLPCDFKDFYPLARSLKRRLHLITGMPNSGKTYEAIARLAQADSGAYLSPLRLLAVEVRETLMGKGVPTTLRTGEMVIEELGAKHICSTIEMVNLHDIVDVAVIDEAQLLSDPDRGGAWFTAILGVPARDVIIIANPKAQAMIERLAAYLDEPLEVTHKVSKTIMEIDSKPIKLEDVPKGSAVIAFSRNGVLDYANQLVLHGKKVAVVYGALTPEVRIAQAKAFSNGEVDVVVATDAIGLGLNLPIKNIYFTTNIKYNGHEEVELGGHLTCQIANRAGRYGMSEIATVGAIDGTRKTWVEEWDEDWNWGRGGMRGRMKEVKCGKATLAYVEEQLKADLPEINPSKFRFNLDGNVVRAIANHFNYTELAQVHKMFNKLSFGTLAKNTVPEEALELAVLVAKLPMEYQHTLSMAPAKQSKTVSLLFYRALKAVKTQEPVNYQPSKEQDLAAMEQASHDATLYSWLHYRFSGLFPDIELASKDLHDLGGRIDALLREKHLTRFSKKKQNANNLAAAA